MTKFASKDTDSTFSSSLILPIPQGPYTNSIDFESLIFISGQIPVDPRTLLIPDNIYDQTYQALKNIQTILQSKELTINNIVKTTLFVCNIDDLFIINKSYKEFFDFYSNHDDDTSLRFPARSCVEVSRLPKNVKIEIESIATRPKMNKK